VGRQPPPLGSRRKQPTRVSPARYVARPMLWHGRKFHIRAYVLAVGALQVRSIPFQ
jgi:hypothetical protein